MKVGKLLLFSLTLLLALPAAPQQARSNAAASASTAVPPLIPYSGVVSGKSAADASVTFLIYKDEQGGEPLFTETQAVALDATGHYKAQLGATLTNGIPMDLFATGDARWLEVQVAGEAAQPRVLLVSVPYALKAADAATLGGLPPSAFALARPASEAAAAVSPAITPNVTSNVTTTGGLAGYIPEFSDASSIVDSPLFVSGAKIGIGTAAPLETLDIRGTAISTGLIVNGPTTIGGYLEMDPVSFNATPATGYNSQIFKLYSSAYNSASKALVNPRFGWQATVTGNNTAAPSATLELLSTTAAVLTPTGFSFNANGTINFAPGQTFPGGTGAITGVTAGTALTGGGTSGNVTLNVDTTKVALLGAANTFVGNQSITGNIGASGMMSSQGEGSFDTSGKANVGLSGLGIVTGVNGQATGTANNDAGVFGYESATTGQVFGVSGNTGSTTGFAAGVNGYESATTGEVFGMRGTANSATGFAAGVSGFESATTGQVFGVQGGTNSTTNFAAGVSGNEGATTGQVFGVSGGTGSTGNGSAAVSGFESAATGMVYGVTGNTNSTTNFSAGVSGYEGATTGQVWGVQGGTNSTGSGSAGVLGNANATTGVIYGVQGGTNSVTANAAGVTGFENATTGQVYGVNGSANSTGSGAAGLNGYEGATTGQVYGVNASTNSTTNYAAGVNGYEGATTGSVWGVSGGTNSPDGAGVFGSNNATTGGTGVSGSMNATSGFGNGVYGSTNSPVGNGVSGMNNATSGGGNGVYGGTNATSGIGNGVLGVAPDTTGTNWGVQGIAGKNGIGVQGRSPYIGILGVNAVCDSSECTPVSGTAGQFTTGTGGTLLVGQVQTSPTAFKGVFSVDAAGNGFYAGNLNVTGKLTKGSGSFKIDDPLDPANKYLSHSFVESPDMMNVYNGNITTDKRGMATIELPEYFGALNRDFRYQLTVMGQFAQAIVAKKIASNRFVIRTSKPNVEVSWQVTGIRQDAYANANRIPVEEVKPEQEQGYYLHPEVFGQPSSKGIVAAHRSEGSANEVARLAGSTNR